MTEQTAPKPTKTYLGEVPYPVITAIPGGKPNLNETLHVIAGRAGGYDEAIRLRIQPQFYPHVTDGSYQAWSGVSWILEFPTATLCSRFRDDLTAFMQSWVEARQAEVS